MQAESPDRPLSHTWATVPTQQWLCPAGDSVTGPGLQRARPFPLTAQPQTLAVGAPRWRPTAICLALAHTAKDDQPMKAIRDCLDAFWDEDMLSVRPPLPMPPHVHADDLAPAERIAYRLINHAAEHDQPCPVNIDLEVAAGFNSTSMGAKLVRNLERRGLIRVSRFQRFRLVEIVATGKQTARHPSMHADRPLVRRGARSAGALGLPGDRKPYAAH